MSEFDGRPSQGYDYGTDGELLSVPREPKRSSGQPLLVYRTNKRLIVGLTAVLFGIYLLFAQATDSTPEAEGWVPLLVSGALSILIDGLIAVTLTRGAMGWRRVRGGLLLLLFIAYIAFDVARDYLFPVLIILFGLSVLLRRRGR